MLTYLAAHMRTPLYDERFSQLDEAIGFYWPRWFEFIQAHGMQDIVLLIAYFSVLPQIFGSILFFAHTQLSNRNWELFCMAVFAFAITTGFAYSFPALGAFYHFDTAISRAVHLPDLFHLVAGTKTSFSLPEMQGIVTFPSYHAAVAVILTYVYRGKLFLFQGIAVLNVVMLLSTPTYGGHYLVDILGGISVAIVSIFIFNKIAKTTFYDQAIQTNNIR